MEIVHWKKMIASWEKEEKRNIYTVVKYSQVE